MALKAQSPESVNIPLVYVTKYALTQGILTFENVERCDGTNPRMIAVRGRFPQYFHNDDWHTDLGAAMARAEKMRAAKLASIEKQAARIRKLKFEVTPALSEK